jgi:hypothetical protein
MPRRRAVSARWLATETFCISEPEPMMSRDGDAVPPEPIRTFRERS